MVYQVISELGRGGFGLVELVQDPAGHRFARKTFSPVTMAGADLADMRRRFEREVRYQIQIDHPNIVKIVYADLENNPPWFIMKLAHCTLKDEMEKDRTLGGQPQKALFDILSGLEALHERGIIHRDLKPANVLKMGDGDRCRYAISDFGLMSATSSESSSLTLTNMGGGTPFYAAPECARSFRRATVLSDIYSFGAILYDIFGSGAPRIPYTALSVSGSLGPIVDRCTKRILHKRYQSIAELRADIYDAIHRENLSFTNNEDKEIINILNSSNSLSANQWERVFSRLDDNEYDKKSNSEILRHLTRDHICDMNVKDVSIFVALARMFASYIQNGVFIFDYCDVVADKAGIFYDLGDPHVKAKTALSLLIMGTNHNRWFVERKFVVMAGPDVSDKVIEGLLIEIKAQGLCLDDLIQRLIDSIGVSREKLHPHLLAALVHV